MVEVTREAEGRRREDREATEAHATCHRGESTCIRSFSRYAPLKCFDHSKQEMTNDGEHESLLSIPVHHADQRAASSLAASNPSKTPGTGILPEEDQPEVVGPTG